MSGAPRSGEASAAIACVTTSVEGPAFVRIALGSDNYDATVRGLRQFEHVAQAR